MDAASQQRLQGLEPSFARVVMQLLAAMAAENIYGRIVQGLRTFAEQQAIWEQGRSTPGKIVTHARAGDSWHNYGLAVDIVPSQFAPDQPFNPDWNASHEVWKRMEALGAELGLTVGATWRSFPDAPHFQMTGRFGDSPDAEVKQLYAAGGVEAVWNAMFAVPFSLEGGTQ